MRTLRNNQNGSAIPLILFILTIFVAGAMYTLFFIEVGLPLLDLIPVPASSSKTLIMTLIYAIPLIVLIVGLISLILAAIKKEGGYYV